MNFKQLLQKHKFVQTVGCISHRIYTNTVYEIEVINITGIVTVIRRGNVVATFNIHDQDISDHFIIC